MADFQKETGQPAQAIAKVSYTHDAMIDLIIADPSVSQGDLARFFGYTQSWVSTVKNSDAFQARLAERKGELVDPAIIASIDEKFRALADSSLSKLIDRVNGPLTTSDDFLLQTAKLSAGALGYGAKAPSGGQTTNIALVVQVPPKIQSSSDWASTHAPLVQRTA